MAKIFICDQCKKEFPQPLDEEMYTDEHGVSQIFDLCAPCRAKLKTEKDKGPQTFFEKIIKEKTK